LKKFYTDWYRPDLMAVVVVGDFDRAAVEGMVKSHFSAIPAATSPKPRPVFDLPDHAGARYAIVSDKEMTATSVEVDHILPAEPDGTTAAYRQKIVDQLFGSMVNTRLGELARKPDPPFVGAGTGRSRFIVRTKDDAVVSAQVREDGIERGLDAVFVELARVRKFGFTPTELDRQKQNMLRSYELNVTQEPNRTSASRAAEYIRNFLLDESLPTAADELALHQRFLADVSLADVNAVAKSWYRDDNRVVVVEAPEKAGLTLPKDTALSAVMTAALAKDVQPYVDSAAGATLLDAPPAPGAVAKTSTTPGGLIEWELANGVHVVLKPTTFKQDEVMFRGVRAGGTSLASDADFVPASSAVAVVTAGGLGKLNASDLGKVMTGKVATAAPYITETSEGVTGSASRKDLETMFQLIYLRFTQPRTDAAAFTNRLSQMKTVLANQTASPGFAFQDAVQKAMYQDNLRRRLLTPDQVDQYNLDASMAFYKARFADATDFRFVFAGSFDPQELKPLVEKYLGSLPSAHRGETFKDLGIQITPGVIDRRVQKGLDPKSQAVIVFSGPMVYDQTQRVAIRAMAEVLQMRLTEVIREELGGTYGVNVVSNYSKIPRPEYTVQIIWGCDPARTDGLIKRVLDEIALLQTNGPAAKHVTDEREALLRDFETSSQDNRFVVDQVSARYQNGEDPDGVWRVTDFYKKLDAAMIQQAAKTYLNAANRITVTLFPEK
jgi:zinc protease